MSKSKKTTAVDAGILAAEEALRRAKLVRDEADATLRAAVQAVFDADHSLRAAKVRADDHLPRADSCVESWVDGRPSRRAVVIVSRTAKTITTRFPGEANEQQWRKDAHGKWRKWPDYGSQRWLELPDDAQ